MDPNETLRQMRAIAARILAREGADLHETAEDATDLALAVDALDTWLCHGGFIPDAWARGAA